MKDISSHDSPQKNTPIDTVTSKEYSPPPDFNINYAGRDFCAFSRQFACLSQSGIGVVKALETLAEQHSPSLFADVLHDVVTRISSGTRLSEAIKLYPRIFRRVYVAMIRVGEETGSLDVCLDKLSDWGERDLRLIQRLKGALAYPAFVLTVTLVLFMVLFWYLVPNFMGMFDTEALPGSTKFVLAVSDAMRNPMILLEVTVAVTALVALIRNESSREEGRIRIFRLLHALPGLGRLLKLTAVTRFSCALHNLLESGMPLVSALERAGESTGNPLYIKASREMTTSLTQGESLSTYAQARPHLFPNAFVQYISTGEESGRLGKMSRPG
mgnify:CR=1 FL=1